MTSFFTQSPLMLFALLSLVIPIIIHLFSKSKGTLVPFANIKLIQRSKPVRMNEVRLVERLLLLCRLLFLFFSVMMLAQVYFDNRSADEHEENLLVTKDWLAHANISELTRLSSQAKRGTVYLLANKNKNKQLTSNDILNWQGSSTHSSKEAEKQSTWLLVSNYIKTTPDNVNVKVYSTNRLSQFIGNKIYLPANVSWEIKHLSEDILAKTLDNLRSKETSLLVISDDTNKEEVAYLNAALSIIKETKLKNLMYSFQTYNINLSDLNNLAGRSNTFATIKLPEKVEWIFYLSSSSVPASILEEVQNGKKLILDIGHKNSKDATKLINWKEQITQLQFPQLLLSLLQKKEIDYYQLQQKLTEEQITSQLPRNKKVNLNTLFKTSQFKSLTFERLLTLLLILFWSVERVLSEIRKTKQVLATDNSVLPSNSQKKRVR